MSTVKILLTACSAVALVLGASCSKTDDGVDNGSAVNPGGGSSGAGSGGGGAGRGETAVTFPVYAQRLIETKTDDTSLPESEAAWMSLADDETYVAPADLFNK